MLLLKRLVDFPHGGIGGGGAAGNNANSPSATSSLSDPPRSMSVAGGTRRCEYIDFGNRATFTKLE